VLAIFQSITQQVDAQRYNVWQSLWKKADKTIVGGNSINFLSQTSNDVISCHS